MRIACIQQDHNPGRVAENRAKALLAAEKALDQGADLILFHEELLIGYHPEAHALAEPADGETTQAFIDLLRRKGSHACIVYGLTEKHEDHWHIAAPVVTAQGLQACYRKTHLWWDAPGLRHEPSFYQPGEGLVTFEHQGHRFGIVICYDGDFPEMFRSYARLGCDAVLWMNNRESRAFDDGPQAAARANSLVIATACCCGTDEKGVACPGLSHIADADGTLLTAECVGEGMAMADVDLDRVPAMRAANPWFTGARFDLY